MGRKKAEEPKTTLSINVPLSLKKRFERLANKYNGTQGELFEEMINKQIAK